MRKNLSGFVFLFIVILFSSSFVIAEEPSSTITGFRPKGQMKQKITNQLKEKQTSLIDKLKEKIKNLFGRRTGEITAINGNTLTIKTSDGKEYTVNISSSTVLRRKFGGKSEISEFSVGDKVNIVGKWSDDTKTILDARNIRNASIQKRWGVFFGEVTAKKSDNFVINTKRGTETVFFGNAKFVNIKQVAITYDDVAIGHRVRVKGTWDRKLNKIDDVSEVKDFSLK